jgi:NADH:ubiquinone oxidoreductase subunit 2 (subunit N)
MDFSGTLSISGIAQAIAAGAGNDIFVLLGIVFISVGLTI